MAEDPLNVSQPDSPSQTSQIANIPDRLVKKSKRKVYDRKVHGKRYPLAQKIAIKAMQSLADSGQMTVTDVAKNAGTTRMQVYRVWEDPELEDLSPEVVNKTKKGLTGLFYKRAMQATLHMTEDKFKQSNLLQLATVSGIMTEKARLSEGLSTENVAHKGLIDTLSSDRDKLMERMQNMEKSISLENQ